MRSIKYTLLLSFCIIAALSIAVLGIVVSWRMSESVAYQSRQISNDMTTQTYEDLHSHHRMLIRTIRDDIQRVGYSFSKNPYVISNLEDSRITAMEVLLRQASQTENLDFAMIFNTEGNLQASFPQQVQDVTVEEFFAAWEPGKRSLAVLKGGSLEDESVLWNAISKHDARELQLLGLGNQDIAHGTISIATVGIIKDDFGDPIGIFLLGKLFHHYSDPLQWVYEVTDSSSVIYLDNIPIAQAGFNSSEDNDTPLSALQVKAGMLSRVYEAEDITDIVLPLAGQTYLLSCSALESSEDGKFGVICAGVPETRIAQAQRQINLYGHVTKKNVQAWIVGIGLGSLGLFASISLLVATKIVTPIKQLSRHANIVATGDFRQNIAVSSRDEIGDLGRSLQRVIDSFREITAAYEAIAIGNVRHQMTPHSDQDVLGHAFQRMSGYLMQMASVAETIAQGDLTVEIPSHSESDMFGQAMQLMITKLRSLIHQIKSSAEQISVTETNIASLADQEVTIVQHAQVSVKDMVSTMTEMGVSVKQVAQNMDILASSAEETSASMVQMTGSVTNIASNITNLGKHTDQTISALSEAVQMLEDVTEQTNLSRQLSQETMQDALEGRHAVEQVKESIDTIAQTNLNAVETITRFEKQSKDIDTILDVIRDITEQSSLLALNASIIAAQAGTHGKGFSIIAEEMRNLANAVQASTKNIGTIVANLQQDIDLVVQMIHAGTVKIDQGVKRTHQAEERLQKILTSAERSSGVVAKIADALHVQMTTIRNVMGDMKQVHAMTNEVTRATNEQKTNSVHIQQAVENITEMTSQTQQATIQQLEGVRLVLKVAENITSLTNQTLENSQHMNRTIAAELASEAKMLLQSIDRFNLAQAEDVPSSSI